MSLYPTQAARKAKRAEEKRRRLETPEIRAAREAREELEKCSAERDEECIYADLARRLDLRERYWTAFETWVRCQRIVEQMKCDKKLRLAVGPDVQIKVDEDIVRTRRPVALVSCSSLGRFAGHGRGLQGFEKRSFGLVHDGA